jgi:hypothetical protein
MFRSAANLERHNDSEVTFCGQFCDESRVDDGETITRRCRGISAHPIASCRKCELASRAFACYFGPWNLERSGRLYIPRPWFAFTGARLRLEFVLMQRLAFGAVLYFTVPSYGSHLPKRAPAQTGSAHLCVRPTIVE